MARTIAVEYVVSGRGNFPVDMLRYDASYPADGTIPRDYAQLDDPDEKVRLIHTCAPSQNKWRPTEARWRSFGWRVVDGSIREIW